MGKPGRKKQLNLKSTPDKDAAYVEVKKDKLDCLKSGLISIGYDFETSYKGLEVEDESIKMFVKKDSQFLRLLFNRKDISKCWYNTSKMAFGFSSGSIVGFPDLDLNGSKRGLYLKPSAKISIESIQELFKGCGDIAAEKETTTDLGCNTLDDKETFTPHGYLKKAKAEQKKILSPRKTKVIQNDSDYDLSHDEEDESKRVTKPNSEKPIKEDKRKIEETTEPSPERPLKKIKKTVAKTKQELSSSESEDISDSEIVTKHHVTRSKTKSTRANLDLDKVVLSKYSIHITLRDISRLEPDEFLNDNIIDFYLRHLEEQFHGPKAKQVKNDFYIFNTHFYQLLKKDSSRAAERIAKNVALFQKRFIFIPVNENVHWSLIVICNPNGCTVKKDKTDANKKYPATSRMLMYCDSLGGAIPSNTTKRVREFLAKRFLFEHPNEKPATFTADNFPVGKANLPKQDNHVDCGVFMIHYIQLIVCANIESLPLDEPELFLTSDIPSKRSSIKRDIEYEISLNPVLTQADQSFNSQSDSVMAISQLDDSEMRVAVHTEEPSENTTDLNKDSADQAETKQNENTAETEKDKSETQESEDLFTEKVLECDADE